MCMLWAQKPGTSLAVAERHCFSYGCFILSPLLFIVCPPPPFPLPLFLFPSCCFGSVLVVVAVYMLIVSPFYLLAFRYFLWFFSWHFFFYHLSLAAFVVAFFFSSLFFSFLVSCVLFVVMGCCQVFSCVHLITFFFFFFANTCAIVLCGFPALLGSASPPTHPFFFPSLFFPFVRAAVPKTMARS